MSHHRPAQPRRTAMHLAAASLALGLALITPAAQAGRGCEARPATVDSVRQALALAARTAQALDASGARVLVLGRAGQDLSAYGLRWSHLALAYQVPGEGDEPPRWRVAHKLNHCGQADAALYRQGLAEFFMDSPHRYEAVLLPLAPALASPLLAVLNDNARLLALDEPRYSMVAYPWAQTYQQSNQWLIETLALAAEPGVQTRRQAQAWLQLKGYTPTVLRLGAFTRLGARITQAHVAFDDHPNSERFADRIATVSADSVLQWLPAAGLAGGPAQVLR